LNSQRTVRLVIAGLIGLGAAALGGIVYLTAIGKDAPETLSHVIVAAVTAIGALLAQTNAVPAPTQPEPVVMAPEV
jgi:hypothetical protein